MISERARDALNAGCVAAAVGGSIALAVARLVGAPALTAAAVPAVFLSTWPLWYAAFPTREAGAGRAIAVGTASVVLAVFLMWVLFGLYLLAIGRDASGLMASIGITVISLLYIGPLLLPIGMFTAYCLRRYQVRPQS